MHNNTASVTHITNMPRCELHTWVILPCTMALTEFQNKCIDVKQSECNTLCLNDFLTLMLQEVSGGELSHGALGLLVPPFPWI